MSLQQPKLYGIDLDGICFDFLHAFCDFLHENAGVTIPADEEITSYYWYETVDGLDKDTFWREFDNFTKADGYRNLKILEGTKEALQAIVDAGHEIMYITNRPPEALEATKAALEEHGLPFRDRLVFAKGAKAPVIREYGVSVFIDDSPRTIAEICANTDATIYCRDYPCNRGIHDIHNYTRVHSWDEFLEAEGLKTNVGTRL
jgi:uncharacterized HAD superfamily protein